MLYWYLFFFITVGAKFILAALMIYLLLPTDRRCSRCDEETLLVRPNRLGRIGSRLSFGRVQWRWCPRCRWEGLARHVPGGPPPQRGASVSSAAQTRH